METDTIKNVFRDALKALAETTPLIGPIATVLVKSAIDADAASESGELTKLNEEAAHQEISLHMAKLQAQVAQELAIAHRIESAAEVEIEEYYEGEGKAGLGATTDGATASLSIGGEARKVTKRVYRFKSK